PQLVDLATAEVGTGVRPVELLDQLADDYRARCVRELLELTQMLLDHPARARPLERRSNEYRPFGLGFEGNQIFSYVDLLSRCGLRAADCGLDRPRACEPRFVAYSVPSPQPAALSGRSRERRVPPRLRVRYREVPDRRADRDVARNGVVHGA